MGRVRTAGNLCGPSWPGPCLPRSSTSHPTAPHLSLGGLKGVNSSELSGGRNGERGSRHNKRGWPHSCADNRQALPHRTHTTASARQGPDEDRDHTNTRRDRCAQIPGKNVGGEDIRPDTMTWVDLQNTHPDMCMHTCTYTHTHTPNHSPESLTDIQINIHVHTHTHRSLRHTHTHAHAPRTTPQSHTQTYK